MKKLLILLFLTCLWPVKALEIVRTTVEMDESPQSVVATHPRLGWEMQSDQEALLQAAYQVQFESTGSHDFRWESKVISSEHSQLLPYHGPALQSGTAYRWRVRVWDEQRNRSAWSNWSPFRMAPKAEDLDAKWIGAIRTEDARIPAGVRFPSTERNTNEYRSIWNNVDSLSRKSILLRKSFTAKRKVTEAVAWISGLGHYEFSINGEKVGFSEFAPFWSDYDKTVYYNSYDILPLLRKGENVFGVLLGNGFYNVQGGRYTKLKVSFGAPTLMLKVRIRYDDGSTQEIRSDETWKYDLSPITFNDIYGGEDYDARLEQPGWDQPRFNDNHWKAVVIQSAPRGRLTPQQADPIKIMQRYGVRTYKKLNQQEIDISTVTTKRKVDPSAVVFDMGQNLSGFPEIKVQGKRGQRITLVVGEALTPEGAPDQRQTGRQHLYHYTLKGEGEEVWHPRFSYYGFRYIQVEGVVLPGETNPDQLAVLKNISSCFVHNAVEEVSTFISSNEIFNQAHVLIEKAVKSNMQAVFTDCPHREKLGWLEQVHTNGPGLLYNYDLRRFAPKIMRDMADAQYPSGVVPTTAPMYNVFGTREAFDEFGDSPEWGSTLIVFPKMYYDSYGDISLIRDYYDAMVRYVDYLGTRSKGNLLDYGLGDWYDYGNFRAGYSRNTPLGLVASAYYLYDLTLMAQYATMLGYEADADKYQSLANTVRRAFNNKYFDKETGLYATGSQTAHALAIYLNMVEPEFKSTVLENLLKDIRSKGNRLSTGDIGNRYLFQTLATEGHNELMYTMHNHEQAPGYGFQLKFGATTLTEQWDPRQGSSWNHFMMGQIDEWFFASLAGILPGSPGYKDIIIRPQVVGDLSFVDASYRTAYGKISVNWKKEGSVFRLNVEIPVNCRAKVYLPGEEQAREVGSGIYYFEKQHL